MSSGPEILHKDDDKPRQDLRLISRAVREGWPIPAEKRAALCARMAEIVQTRTIQVPDVDGVFHDRADVAASHAIAAARVLVAADAVNQTDYWNSDKNDRLDAGKATERNALEAVILRQAIIPSSENT